VVNHDFLKAAERLITDPDTGGQKGQKPERYSLIPAEALAEVARVYGFGASKYEDNNWRKGYAWSLSLDALGRHIEAFRMGQSQDPESGLHHLAHAVFHLMTLMTFDATWLPEGPEVSDLQMTYWSKDDRPL